MYWIVKVKELALLIVYVADYILFQTAITFLFIFPNKLNNLHLCFLALKPSNWTHILGKFLKAMLIILLL